MSESSKDAFQAKIEMIASILLNDVNAKLKVKEWRLISHEWDSVYVDLRWSETGSTRIDKMRVVLQGGKIFSRLDMPLDASLLFDEIHKLRDKAFSDKWYGIKLTVQPDGGCHLELNHDINAPAILIFLIRISTARNGKPLSSTIIPASHRLTTATQCQATTSPARAEAKSQGLTPPARQRF